MSTRYAPAFRLLTSSRRLFERAVEDIGEGYLREDKHVVLTLAAAIELILKARLALEDPLKLAKRHDGDATLCSLETPAFRSVSVREAVKRVEDAGLLELTDRQLENLALLQSIRNRVAHHIDSTEPSQVSFAIGAGLHLWIEIHDSAFEDDEVYRARPLTDLIQDLSRFEPFVAERMHQLQGQLRSSTRPLTRYFDECSTCLQDASVIEVDRVKCLFCGLDGSIRDWAHVISHDGSVGRCPDCGFQSVVHQRWHGESTHECLCCGYFIGKETRWLAVDGSAMPRLKEDVIGPPTTSQTVAAPRAHDIQRDEMNG